MNIQVNLPANLRAGAKLKGTRVLEIFNNKEEMKLISRDVSENILEDAGLDGLLDILLHNATQIHPWYCVIFEDDFTPDGDETYAVPGYTEWEAYEEATRPEYEEAASSSQSVTNSASKASFEANATKTLYGAGLVGGGSAPTTKGNSAGGGTLLCAGRFGASQPVVDDNVVNLTYTVTAADDGV